MYAFWRSWSDGYKGGWDLVIVKLTSTAVSSARLSINITISQKVGCQINVSLAMKTRHYIIWDLNMYTRTYAEYSDYKIFNHCQSRIGLPSPLLGNQSPRTPTSPWTAFLMFAAITTKLSSLDIFTTHYEVFKKRKISRSDLVKSLKQIIGDKLLLSTILRLEHDDTYSTLAEFIQWLVNLVNCRRGAGPTSLSQSPPPKPQTQETWQPPPPTIRALIL
ncbi:hypothetical protein OPV22_006279 [Ensete ventricosum]|uniref:RST domain-containing protein n=1 Tax=Ensete ventricosum TaxID=4639 RepID=A0AAV8RSP4_ENSVE|nr:hypothetical protein OPV22_006279 [Ensete ventricosum]